MEITASSTGNYIKKDDWKATATPEGKIQLELVFKLIDDKKTENFSIWDNKEKKYYKEGDTLVDKDGDEHDFKTILYTSKAKLVEAFPGEADKDGKPTTHLQKSYKWDMNVVVDNTEATINLGKMACDELDKAIKMTKSFGKDPMQTTYKLCKTGEKIETKYWVEIVNDLVEPSVQAVANSIAPPVKKEGDIGDLMQEPVNDEEKAFVEKYSAGNMKHLDGSLVALNKPGFLKAYMEYGGNDVPRGNFIWNELIESKK